MKRNSQDFGGNVSHCRGGSGRGNELLNPGFGGPLSLRPRLLPRGRLYCYPYQAFPPCYVLPAARL